MIESEHPLTPSVVKLAPNGACNHADDVATCLEALAGKIRAGGITESVIVVVHGADRTVSIECYGRPGETVASVVGKLFMATLREALE